MNAGQDAAGKAEPGAWEYAAPPTAYDRIRDNAFARACRRLVHLAFRGSMRWYHGLRVIGRERVLDCGPCIITPNHTSHLDCLAVFAALPWREVNRTYSAAAKDYFFEHAALAVIARMVANGIPLDRTGGDPRGLRLCARKLKAGGRVIMFPEGTRTRTGGVCGFKPGAAALARGLRVPVVPTYLQGTFESLSRFQWFPRPRRIVVSFGEPLRFWEGELAGLDHAAAALVLESRVRALGARLGEEERRT